MKLRDLNGKRVAFWGAGRETSSLASRLGELDVRPASTLLLIDQPEDAHDDFAADATVTGAEVAAVLENVDVVLRSPLVNPSREELTDFRARGGALTTPTGVWLAEFADQLPMIGVTGTKGKSTSATLAAHLLGESGKRVELAGNIGRSVWTIDDPLELDHVALELSSYQLVDAPASPRTLLITNLFPEHLDWHGGQDAYFAAKLRAAKMPGVRAALNPEAATAARELWPDEFTAFGSQGDFETDGQAVLRDGGSVLELGELSAPGSHNLTNLCGVLTALRLEGIEVDDVRAATASFEPLRDRLETVAEHDGVRWVCDQMHASPEAVVAAVDTLNESSRRLILIVGGRYRGQQHLTLARLMSEHHEIHTVCVEESGAVACRELVEAGIAADRLTQLETIPDGVDHAAKIAGDGDTVIFCPMAPVRDFLPPSQRSHEFRSALAALIGEDRVTP